MFSFTFPSPSSPFISILVSQLFQLLPETQRTDILEDLL